jgi:uncharacterized membrane protein YbhN (UPF0104 family)
MLAAVVWRLGAGPFLDGVRSVDGRALAAAAAIALLTTLCSAWRWTVVARGLGLRLSLPAAVASCYRSVFLNLTLPGGVAGDVHRGVSHGREAHDVGRALRAVGWERTAGQVVQAVLTLAVLLVLPSPVRSSMPVVAGVVAVTGVALVLLGRTRGGTVGPRWARVRTAVASDVRAGLLHRRALPVVVLASGLVVLGHAVTFLIAARATGVTAPVSRLLPLALLAMLGMVLPSVAGWGPREGVTAWVFASAGLGADRGAATAVAYGVLVLAASLPGALVLALPWAPRRVFVPRREGAADA